ncbi:hypothetical protein EHI8A_191150 [Entamoeba histolytica HM-1:IMSS-B]|uniref:DM1 domain-containing protein n=6 Tax=Entamoeba histolytica TaxID=5759 RepID=C4MA66_ENTH1|nr:hypothetical protein EHI_070010 [Entamoeba histolytica HM-1:IMSS]EMD45384.1 Hypothetical protein EHI5A_065050 [Entamoeba histolytica KU27]EMH78236.1 hypothetical protein EHI8A_191150 [Entamoeba histolytica HM-1:IMSS-B]EMS11615.1 hypothetical protein KM1_067220 [Entamoeba histolytica HM-3:IMSS]ENY62848.1 hypothetical protein EHI7A_044710 [Entamoeba histolytica HM-1:IMSS-A]GAT98653.1 hypothetical protein CL6EHI_070010 [Entamoeba histolytica]|eukprot:XP_648787.1 hypothetical protein EHI_070010 [Entamoeba histolytica HM-1:IMSS]
MQESLKDEIIPFTVPSFNNSIFIEDVDENDENEMIVLFTTFGLLYKANRLKNNPSTMHFMYFSHNAWIKCHNQLGKYFKIHSNKYELKIFNPKKLTNNQHTLRLPQMYNLCNYYIGFNAWSTEIISITCDFKDEIQSNGITKYVFQYTTITQINFIHFPNVICRGYGRSKYTGKDYNRADRTCKKFSVACSRKDMFKKLVICILVTIKDGVCEQKAVPTTIEIGKQDEDGLNQLFIQNYEEDKDEPNELNDQDFEELLKLI